MHKLIVGPCSGGFTRLKESLTVLNPRAVGAEAQWEGDELGPGAWREKDRQHPGLRPGLCLTFGPKDKRCDMQHCPQHFTYLTVLGRSQIA